jgi:hypothetical protein
MPIPTKITLFRDQTQCYPCDKDGTVWHVYGRWGPMCEIVFPAPGAVHQGAPELVFQDAPDFIGGFWTDDTFMEPYKSWEDRRTGQDQVVPEGYEGLIFVAKRFGLNLTDPQHRVVASLVSDALKKGLLTELTEAQCSDLVQGWLGKVGDAITG